MRSLASFARTHTGSTLLCALVATAISLSSPAVATNNLPVISGRPATSVTLPNLYTFQPTGTEAGTGRIKFDIHNMPVWATFDTTTGLLAGRPNRLQAGAYSGIVIRAINYYGATSLPAFTVTVSAAAQPNTPPSIYGSPVTSIQAGTAYNFTPKASDADHNTLTFSVQNKPDWAKFSTTSGAMSGTPEAVDVGTYAKIMISVSDGKTSVSLPTFAIAVNQISNGNASLDWTPPTENTDGTVLTNLAGYHLHYGRTAQNLSETAKVTNPGLTSYVVDGLASGTWYFAMSSYTAGGIESANTGTISTSVQ